jgi:hypothetical protein
MEEPDAGGDDPEVPATLHLDYLYDALAHPRRRYLCHLLSRDGEWTLADIARAVAAVENDVPASGVTELEYEGVYTSLYHAHIPKLAEGGVVTFDPDAEVVGAGEHADRVLAALEAIRERLDPGERSGD